MFVVERIFDNMTPIEFKEYYNKLSLTLSEYNMGTVIHKVKELLKEEVETGYRDEVTGEKTTPNAKPEKHTIKFDVYYNNTGKKNVAKTLAVFVGMKDTKAKILAEVVVDSKCSHYIYEIETSRMNVEITHALYENGASSVYLAR